jgi:chromosome partitioning protein
MRLTVANVKGGVGKTTTAVHLAAGLHVRGKTLLVDADPKPSAYQWSLQDGVRLPFPVIHWATRDVHQRIAQVAADYRHIVIDTGPEQEAIIRSALMASDTLLIPLAPSTMDINRLPVTLDVANEARELGSSFTTHVLLTRARARARSVADMRDYLTGQRISVLPTAVRQLDRLALAYGSTVDDLGDYAGALTDLLRAMKKESRHDSAETYADR